MKRFANFLRFPTKLSSVRFSFYDSLYIDIVLSVCIVQRFEPQGRLFVDVMYCNIYYTDCVCEHMQNYIPKVLP